MRTDTKARPMPCMPWDERYMAFVAYAGRLQLEMRFHAFRGFSRSEHVPQDFASNELDISVHLGPTNKLGFMFIQPSAQSSLLHRIRECDAYCMLSIEAEIAASPGPPTGCFAVWESPG